MIAFLEAIRDTPPSNSLAWFVLADDAVDPDEHDCCEWTLTARREGRVVCEGTTTDVNDDAPVFIMYVVEKDANE